MSEVELERLVVRLVGDSSSYLKTLQGASVATTQTVSEIDREAQKLTAAFSQQAATMGMTGREASIYRLQLSGATQEQLASLKAADAKLSKMEQERALMAQGATLTESVATATQKHSAQVAHINKLFEAGVISKGTYQRALARVDEALRGTGQTIQATGQAFTAFSASAVQSIMGIVGVVGGLGLAFRAVSIAAEAEDMKIAFSTMQQSVTLGESLVDKLTDFAAKTPLNLQDLQQSSKMLLQFGISGQQILPTLKMLGDVTGGSAERLQRMSLAFGQMESTGKVFLGDIYQMVNAGFNPLKEVARTSGRTLAQVKADLEQGIISVDTIKEAFKSATSAGGAFYNGMENASKGLKGLTSTMQDDIAGALRALGQLIDQMLNLKGAVKSISAGAQDLAKWFKSIPTEIQYLVTLLTKTVGIIGALNLAMRALVPVLWMVTGALKGFLLGLHAIVFNLPGIIAQFALFTMTAQGLQVVLSGLAVGLAAVTFGYVARAAMDATKEVQDLNRALDENDALTDKMTKRIFKTGVKDIEEALALVNPDEKLSALEDLKKRFEREAETYRKSVEVGKKKIVDELVNSPFIHANKEEGIGFGGSIGQLAERALAPVLGRFREAPIKDAEKQLTTMVRLVERAEAEIDKLAPGKAADALNADLRKTTKEMEDQVATMGLLTDPKLRQMTAEEKHLRTLELQAARLGVQLDKNLKIEAQKQIAAIRTISIQNEQQKFIDALEVEGAAWNTNALELAAYQAALNGTIGSQRELERVLERTKVEAKINEFVKLGRGTEAQAEEMRKAADLAARKKEELKLFQEGFKLKQEFLTPVEKRVQEEKRLAEIFGAGAISALTYARALEKLAEASGRLQGRQATLARSLEALARIREFREPALYEERVRMRALDAEQGRPGPLARLPEAAKAGGAEALRRQVEQARNIDLIRQILARIEKKTSVIIPDLDLEGS